MQCLLNIAYKLDIQRWRATTPEMKEKMSAKKKFIQNGFKRKLGLIIDVPKHGSLKHRRLLQKLLDWTKNLLKNSPLF